MKMRFKMVICNILIVLILSFLMLPSPLMAQKDTITWRVTPWPPIYILEGPYKGQGVGDELIKFYSEQMPEYQHKTVIMNIKRFYHEAKKGSKVCNIAGFPIDGVQASLPNCIVVPHQVVIRKDKAHLLASKQIVSLDKLLSDKHLSAGVTFGRYGKVLNQIIDKHKGEEGIFSTTNYENILKMLFAGRIDYTIEYPPVIRYYERLEKKEDIVLNVPIKENSELQPYLIAYVIGPKNEWGNRIMAKVNRIILDQRNTERYRELLLRWYDEKTRRQVRGYLDIVFSSGK